MLLSASQEIGRILGGMITKANLFCKPYSKSVRENLAGYFAQINDLP